MSVIEPEYEPTCCWVGETIATPRMMIMYTRVQVICRAEETYTLLKKKGRGESWVRSGFSHELIMVNEDEDDKAE